MKTIAELIPSKARGVIYALIGTYLLLDPIWNITPDGYGGKVSATLGVLGFGLAVANTNLVSDSEPHADRGESALMTLVLVAGLIVLVILIFRMLKGA